MILSLIFIMMRNYSYKLILSILFILFCCPGYAFYSLKDEFCSSNKVPVYKIKGNSIQIDPHVLYSLKITPDSLIRDLKRAKITSVHFIVVNKWDGRKDDNLFRMEYFRALKKNKIAVWLMLPGNCMYDQLPKSWEMEFLKPYPEENLRFYSFHNEEYIEWQEQRIKRIFENYEFDGIGFAESYFPEWNTINTNGHYGDVSLFARKKFTKDYLQLDIPVFSIDSILNNAELFSQWQDYRAEAILNFNIRMKNAVKKANKNTIYATWAIAVLGGSVSEIRKHYGLDLIQLAIKVSPDVLFIQTSYNEWGNPTLPSNYFIGYNYAKDAILNANPNIKIGIQTDIASLSFHNPGVGIRLPNWWLEFMNLATDNGYYTNTSYEYAFCKKQGLWID